MKAKFDKAALQTFFLQHVEKFILVLIVLGFFAFVWGAISHKGYQGTPGELETAARRAKEHILETPAAKGDLKVVDYSRIVAGVTDRSQKRIASEPYALATLLDPPIFEAPQLRGEPKVLAVRELRGAADLGAFNMRVGDRGETRGQRWVVITGVVPVAEQAEAYLKTFRGNHLDTDVPKYYHYWVERAEVPPGGGDLTYTQLNVMAALEVQKRWAGGGHEREVVPMNFVQERLVFPLGPRTDAEWNDKVAHPPEIALKTAIAAPDQPSPGPTPTAPGTKPDLPPGDMPPMPNAPSAQASAPAPAAEKSAASASNQYLLFRFFDFDVKPGAQYRYRVKLLLVNPNLGVETRRLEQADLAKKKVIESDWSEPTPVIAVPRDDRMRVLAAKPATVRADPTATLLLMKWQEDTGTQIVMGKDPKAPVAVQRGQLLNIDLDMKADAAPSESTDLSAIDNPPPAAKSKSAGRKITFNVNMLLLDIRGGDKLPGPSRDQSNTEPGELLLQDVDGSLVVRSELDVPSDIDQAGAVKAAPAEGEPAAGGGLLNLNP